MAADVIDETFMGLEHPRQVVKVGRPDIERGRPGESLVEEVKGFVRDGGRERLRAERTKAVEEANAPDVRKKPLDHGFNVPTGAGREDDEPAADRG